VWKTAETKVRRPTTVSRMGATTARRTDRLSVTASRILPAARAEKATAINHPARPRARLLVASLTGLY